MSNVELVVYTVPKVEAGTLGAAGKETRTPALTETVYVDCLRTVQNNEEYQAMTAIQDPALQLVLPGTDPSYFMEL